MDPNTLPPINAALARRAASAPPHRVAKDFSEAEVGVAHSTQAAAAFACMPSAGNVAFEWGSPTKAAVTLIINHQ